MPNKARKPGRKSGGWSAVRPRLLTWEKAALLALVKELYDAAAENRDFIEARCQPGDGGAALERSRRKIVEQFFPARGEGKLKLGEARKAIRDYRRATRDVPGTAELLMTYVENGTRFSQTHPEEMEYTREEGPRQAGNPVSRLPTARPVRAVEGPQASGRG